VLSKFSFFEKRVVYFSFERCSRKMPVVTIDGRIKSRVNFDYRLITRRSNIVRHFALNDIFRTIKRYVSNAYETTVRFPKGARIDDYVDD